MNLLARREHSATELLRKLQARGFEEPAIRVVLDHLTQENLLSHERFVESYIHARCNKGFGPVRIQAELTQRGIPQELIDPHLKITDNAWIIKIREVWQKRFKNQLPKDAKTRAQQMRFLYGRGFTAEQIESVF